LKLRARRPTRSDCGRDPFGNDKIGRSAWIGFGSLVWRRHFSVGSTMISVVNAGHDHPRALSADTLRSRRVAAHWYFAIWGP
jgi:hypothetical protein